MANAYSEILSSGIGRATHRSAIHQRLDAGRRLADERCFRRAVECPRLLFPFVRRIIADDEANIFMVDLLDAYAMADYVVGDVSNPNYSIVFDAFDLRKDPAAR